MTQCPIVHINGTHPASLLHQWSTAERAINEAIAILRQVEVHGRDYYPLAQPGMRDPTLVAYAEHQQRIRTLVAVHRELEQITESVLRQVEARQQPLPPPKSSA